VVVHESIGGVVAVWLSHTWKGRSQLRVWVVGGLGSGGSELGNNSLNEHFPWRDLLEETACIRGLKSVVS